MWGRTDDCFSGSAQHRAKSFTNIENLNCLYFSRRRAEKESKWEHFSTLICKRPVLRTEISSQPLQSSPMVPLSVHFRRKGKESSRQRKHCRLQDLKKPKSCKKVVLMDKRTEAPCLYLQLPHRCISLYNLGSSWNYWAAP